MHTRHTTKQPSIFIAGAGAAGLAAAWYLNKAGYTDVKGTGSHLDQ